MPLINFFYLPPRNTIFLDYEDLDFEIRNFWFLFVVQTVFWQVLVVWQKTVCVKNIKG